MLASLMRYDKNRYDKNRYDPNPLACQLFSSELGMRLLSQGLGYILHTIELILHAGTAFGHIIAGRSRLQPSHKVVIVMKGSLISPDPFIQKCRSLAKASSIYLELKDSGVRLAWIADNDKDDFMERADAIGLGITYDMLLDALFESGGSTNANGHYPINDGIRRQLKRLLNIR
jgi:hypothetical protein